MTTLKVTMVEGRPAVFLPTELAERLELADGSELVFDDGAIQPRDEVADTQFELMKEVTERRRDVLRRLA